MQPDSINRRAQILREQQLTREMELCEQQKEEEAAIAAAVRREEKSAKEVEALCQQFYQWATKHKIPSTPSDHWRLSGWRLSSTKWSSLDHYDCRSETSQLWVTSTGEIRMLKAGAGKSLFKPNIHDLANVSTDMICGYIANYVNINGIPWDQ